MDEIEKIPIPEDKVERFWAMVLMLAQEMGIDNHKDIYHNVELLGESVERHIVESNLPSSPQKRLGQNRAKFIAIFKKRYVILTDFEYEKVITPADGKLIGQINKKLSDNGMDCDDYMKWLFEDYLPDNLKFCPPSIKQICAQFFISKFLFDYKDVAKDKKKKKLRESEALDLLNRCRVLARLPDQDQDIVDAIKETVRVYAKEKDMSLEELRKRVLKWEG